MPAAPCTSGSTMTAAMWSWRSASSVRHLVDRLRLVAQPLVRRGHDVAAHQQRVVGVAEDRDVGDGQRADGLAVIAVLQADELALVRETAVAPGMEALLQRDLDRRGAIAPKNRCPSAPPVRADRRSASRTAGSCVQPASITCGSVSSRRLIASFRPWSAWPNRFTHHDGCWRRNSAGPRGRTTRALAAGDGQRRHVLRARHLRARCQTAARLRRCQSCRTASDIQKTCLGKQGRGARAGTRVGSAGSIRRATRACPSTGNSARPRDLRRWRGCWRCVVRCRRAASR